MGFNEHVRACDASLVWYRGRGLRWDHDPVEIHLAVAASRVYGMRYWTMMMRGLIR